MRKWKGELDQCSEGCLIVHVDDDDRSGWWLERYPLELEDFGLDDPSLLPDMSWDPESGILSFFNGSNIDFSMFTVSLSNCNFFGRHDLLLPQHTIVALLAPLSVLDVGTVIPLEGMDRESVDIFSDVRPIEDYAGSVDSRVPDALSVPKYRIQFPLEGTVLCNQSCGGRFTHFLPHTRFAVDLACPIGTPVLAVADGIVRVVKCDKTVSDTHASALWAYNCITIEHTGGAFVDYVHVKAHSARVNVGDRVTQGQVICESGNVGFCPTPHLHLQVAASIDDDAQTEPFTFETADGDAFIPMAGEWCSSEGIQKPPRA